MVGVMAPHMQRLWGRRQPSHRCLQNPEAGYCGWSTGSKEQASQNTSVGLVSVLRALGPRRGSGTGRVTIWPAPVRLTTVPQ